ncbi:MAG: LacI family DNA-binding transcriptional regulator, partial [Syntrophothermus sp.]
MGFLINLAGGVGVLAVTIKDVARIAEVSPSTVSRVIAGHPRISAATQQKVRKAMRE